MSNHAHTVDHHHDTDSLDVYGFWLYIMTDCVLFGTLFAAFIVLHHPGAYGPSFKHFIEPGYVLGETFFLLASNFTFGLSILSVYKNKVKAAIFCLILTFILGLGFVYMEINEFVHLYQEGYTWHVSGAASSFFVLVATHGFHVSIGLLWISVMVIQLSKFKINSATKKRLTYLGLFWNFLDIVWIFLFTIVYLMGAL